MANMSGNFDTAQRELAVVKYVLDKSGIKYENLKKYPIASDADISFECDNKEILVEVKEESYDRFLNYRGDLGFDYLSVFHFKADADKSELYGVKSGKEKLDKLSEAIDYTKSFKRGKVFYSKAQIWLFFVTDEENKIYYLELFDGRKITTEVFRDKMERNCSFAVNNKTASQMSNSDRYNSATFFVKHSNSILDDCRIKDLKKFIKEL